MSSLRDSCFDQLKSFANHYNALCITLLGIAVVGYAIGRCTEKAVSWISGHTGTTQKTDIIGRTIIDQKNKPLIDHTTSLSDTPQSSPLRVRQLQAIYYALKTPAPSQSMHFTYIEPTRRICGFGGMESQRTLQRVRTAIFIKDQEIIKKHPMRFLPHSPFIIEDSLSLEGIENEAMWSDIVAHTKKQAEAIAITEDGKYVILQQAVKSCVPTCIAMLLLDRGEKPNYEAIATTHLANTRDAIEWVAEASLTCQVTKLPKEKIVQTLSQCLAEKGPGMLSINHFTIGGHAIVVNEISTQDNTAVIRDSFHGWMLTMRLDVLTTWLDPGAEFLQII